MWLIFAIIALLCYALSDLLGKKLADGGDALALVKILASVGALALVLSIVLYAFGIGESGMPPWLIICKHPMILLSVVCFLFHWMFFLFSIRYIGLSMDEAVQSTFGVFYFVGLVLINIFTGKLSSVGEMLHPLRLVPIIFVLIFTFLLPNSEVLSPGNHKKSLAIQKKERRSIITGIVLLLFSTVFDSLDSLIATTVLANGDVGAFDYMQASYLAQGLPFIIFSIIIAVKQKKIFIPFVKCGKYSLIYVFAVLCSSVVYLISCSYDAVRTGIIFIAYPVVPIFGAKIFLREKYTLIQNICIWTITLSAILFCFADAFLCG